MCLIFPVATLVACLVLFAPSGKGLPSFCVAVRLLVSFTSLPGRLPPWPVSVCCRPGVMSPSGVCVCSFLCFRFCSPRFVFLVWFFYWCPVPPPFFFLWLRFLAFRSFLMFFSVPPPFLLPSPPHPFFFCPGFRALGCALSWCVAPCPLCRCVCCRVVPFFATVLVFAVLRSSFAASWVRCAVSCFYLEVAPPVVLRGFVRCPAFCCGDLWSVVRLCSRVVAAVLCCASLHVSGGLMYWQFGGLFPCAVVCSAGPACSVWCPVCRVVW